MSKDITKKLVESDYKHKRVSDPAKMDRKYSHAAKKYTAEFLNKAVKRNVEKRKKEREGQKMAVATKNGAISTAAGSTTPPSADLKFEEDEEEVQVSDDEMPDAEEEQNVAKRKRDSETPATPAESDAGTKKLKVEAPPPPPPPPAQVATNDDGSATPTDEAPQQEPSPTDTNESEHKDFAKMTMVNGHRSPMQLATPLTNGSSGHAGSH